MIPLQSLIALQLAPEDFLQLLNAIIASNTYYIIIFVIFGWEIYDHFFRKKYILHIVQEEGESLTEVKTFNKPLSWAGKWLEWKIRGTRGQRATVREYKLDPKNVVFTDKHNKRHIVNSVSNAFNFHPYSDTPDKIEFSTIARASAEDLGATISKEGFLTRMEGVAGKLNLNRTTMIMLVGVGIAIGVAIIAVYPTPFGLEHIAPVASQVSQTTTSTISTQSNPQIIK